MPPATKRLPCSTVTTTRRSPSAASTVEETCGSGYPCLCRASRACLLTAMAIRSSVTAGVELLRTSSSSSRARASSSGRGEAIPRTSISSPKAAEPTATAVTTSEFLSQPPTPATRVRTVRPPRVSHSHPAVGTVEKEAGWANPRTQETRRSKQGPRTQTTRKTRPDLIQCQHVGRAGQGEWARSQAAITNSTSGEGSSSEWG